MFVHTANSFTFMLKMFSLYTGGLGQLADGSYLKISLHALVSPYKKFVTFVHSFPKSSKIATKQPDYCINVLVHEEVESIVYQ